MRCSAESPSLGSVVCCPDKGGRGMKITVINMYRSFCYKKKSHHGKESGIKNNIIKIMENRVLGRLKSKTTPA